MTEPTTDSSGARRPTPGSRGAGSGPGPGDGRPATGAKAAAVGLWVVVAAGLAYGVSQALVTAGKLFG